MGSLDFLKIYENIESEEIEWLWKPYIAFGKITILQGDPGDGKSTFILNLISMLTNGTFKEVNMGMITPINVIYQCSEDGAADTIKPRLERLGADCSRVAYIDENMVQGLTLDDMRLRDAIVGFRARLVVIDPIQAYIGNDSDLQIATRARRLMRLLSIWASIYNCAIVLIGHMNKKESSKGLYRGLGSIDVIAAARSVLQIERGEDPSIRIVRQIKNSLAGLGEEVQFCIEEGYQFTWIKQSEIGNSKNTSTEKAMPKLSKYEIAAEMIKNMLMNQERKAEDVLAALECLDLGESTIAKAKKAIGVRSFRKQGIWYWRLPQ